MFPYRWEYVWTRIDLWNRLRVRRRQKASLRHLGYDSRRLDGGGKWWIVTKNKIAVRPHAD